jgi:hypothetical protein
MRLLGHPSAQLALLVAGLLGGAAAMVGLALELRDGALPAAPAATTEADLQRLSDELGRPVFWLGPAEGRTLELSRTETGRVFLRYLPANAPVDPAGARYPTVATYPVKNAYGVAVVGAQRSGGLVTALPDGGALITYVTRPRSAYYVRRGVDAQVEVFDPHPGRAAKRVRNGELGAVPSVAALATSPSTASEDALRALPRAVGHPIYWAGRRHGVTYELTRPAGGGVYVRYLPREARVGDVRPVYLTVATYPAIDVAAARAQAERTGARIEELDGGRLLISPRGRPQSAYLVERGNDVEVEVFAPEAGRAAALIRSGRIVALR